MISQEDFNKASRTLPVLVNARPFGRYSMVDIDAKGGLPVIVRELLDAGVLDGDCITCTGETLAGQVARLAPPPPDGEVMSRRGYITWPYQAGRGQPGDLPGQGLAGAGDAVAVEHPHRAARGRSPAGRPWRRCATIE